MQNGFVALLQFLPHARGRNICLKLPFVCVLAANIPSVKYLFAANTYRDFKGDSNQAICFNRVFA